MPIGIVVNVASVIIGALAGNALRERLSESLKDTLPSIFAFASMIISIPLMGKADTGAVAILALILGAILGEVLHLEPKLQRTVRRAYLALFRKKGGADGGGELDNNYVNLFMPIIVMFCFSGTGIFGAMNEGFTGDPSVLLMKSILDFFTALIFGAVLDAFVALISIPQAVMSFALFFMAKLLLPLISAAAMANFSAVGGVISMMAGFRLAKIKDINIINVLPSLLLVFPLTALWNLLAV